MFKIFRILSLLAVLPALLTGQQAEMPSASAPDSINSLLWEISGDSIQTSYLFGTIHIIPTEDYFLPEGTVSAIDASDMMVFEIDMQGMMDNPMSQMGLMMQAFMNDGSSLRTLLSEEDYNLVKEHFDKIGLPLFIFERVKPMFLSMFASNDFSMADMSMESSKSYEMEFLEMANTRNLEVGGLETAEYQMSVFDSIPYDVQADMLVESIKGGDTESDDFDQLIEMYKSQDVEGLYEVLAASGGEMMEYEGVLVSGRNKNWIPVMEDLMSTKATFFAVGAGHLGGRDGVIALLRERGYKLEPIFGDVKAVKREVRKF